MPSADHEEEDSKGADEATRRAFLPHSFAPATKRSSPWWLEENANYGFRRNLWGMKPIAITVLLIATGVVSTQIHPNWLDPGKFKPVVAITLVFNAILLLALLLLITPKWIRPAAEAYARQLLSTCDQLPIKEAKKP